MTHTSGQPAEKIGNRGGAQPGSRPGVPERVISTVHGRNLR
jgi:hypothetical protein